jgi:hypothetical protein
MILNFDQNEISFVTPNSSFLVFVNRKNDKSKNRSDEKQNGHARDDVINSIKVQETEVLFY